MRRIETVRKRKGARSFPEGMLSEISLCRSRLGVWGLCGDQIVGARPESGKVVFFEGAASWLWSRLEQPVSLERLFTQYSLEKQMAYEEASHEILRVAGELLREGLICLISGTGSP